MGLEKKLLPYLSVSNCQCYIFLGNYNIGNLGAILVYLVVCVHINSIFGIDCGEYKVFSQACRNRRT